MAIKAIARFIIKNRKAGNDLINLSFTLICILIDPNSKTANPKLPIKVIFSNCIEANNIKAKLTFKNPMK